MKEIIDDTGHAVFILVRLIVFTLLVVGIMSYVAGCGIVVLHKFEGEVGVTGGIDPIVIDPIVIDPIVIEPSGNVSISTENIQEYL